MAYRGEDLDLRVPQARVAARSETFPPSDYALNGTRPRQPMTTIGSRDPVVVDDTVMAACNHAYDIAQAHGASEVRLEHLVHALTRVEAAAEILEERGIREGHLRRESAAVIASEIPVGLAHSQSAPRASAEFEDVLRRASDLAQQRAGTNGATVYDLLWVLLNYNREIPAIALLLRHAAGWQQWDWPNRPMQRREPARDPVRIERTSPPPRVERVERMADRRAAPPPPRTPYVPASSNGSEATTMRLDRMEQLMRTMQSEAAADRRMMTDLMRSMQRDMQDNRAGSGDAGVVMEQLRAVEANVEERLEHLARTATALADRLQGVEASVSGSVQEGSRNWLTVGDRLQSIDRAVSSNSDAGLGDLVTEQLVQVTDQVRMATDRLNALENTMELRHADGQRAIAGVGEHVRSVGERLEQLGAGSEHEPEALQSLLDTRFQSFDGQMQQHGADLTAAVARMVEPVSQRMAQLETVTRTQGETMPGTVARVVEPMAVKVAQIDGALRAQVEATKAETAELHDALVKLGINQQTLAGNLEQWRVEGGGDLSIISNRLQLLERGAAKPVEMLTQLQSDMQAVAQVALADYDHNQRGFKHWLFGTDDVFAGTWKDETKALRLRLKQAKNAGRPA